MLNLVQQYISKFDRADSWHVYVRIFVNNDFLGRKYQSEGIVRDENILRLFGLGFTQGRASFDIVDSGRGKDRVDYKVKG